ncbi:MAG: S8 family serine peptidase, partial [Candidatus Methylomirabilaceae bacterium]
THVAGSAAAVTNNQIGVAGTAPGCGIANIKVLEDNGGGYAFSIAVGILQCAMVAHVCSMSFGGPVSSSLIEFYINEAWLMGAVLVAAAGNSNTDALLFPCAYEVVICVGATNRVDGKASFSSYGSHVDIGAPGEAILSTAPNHRNTIWRRPQTYGTLSGTSMATPHVSGVAGLARGLCSDNVCTRSRVENGADQIPALSGFFVQGRRLNAKGSVTPSP